MSKAVAAMFVTVFGISIRCILVRSKAWFSMLYNPSSKITFSKLEHILKVPHYTSLTPFGMLISTSPLPQKQCLPIF